MKYRPTFTSDGYNTTFIDRAFERLLPRYYSLLLDSNVLDRIEIVKMIEILEYRIKNKIINTVLLKSLLTLIDYIQESGLRLSYILKK